MISSPNDERVLRFQDSVKEYKFDTKCVSCPLPVQSVGQCVSVSYLSHDVSLTASVTILLQTARVTHGPSAVCHLAGRVTDRQAALEVHCQLGQAL